MRSRNSLIFIIIILALFSLLTCTLPGDVYLMVVWTPTIGLPSAFTCAPALPSSPALPGNGVYYKVSAGDYTVTSQFAANPAQLLDFPLLANKTLLGKEDAYYDLEIFANATPVIRKVPSKN
jgi:hypothetical protein